MVTIIYQETKYLSRVKSIKPVYILLFCLIALPVFGQELNNNKLISLNCEDQDLITILNDIREQASLEFVFEPALLQGKKVTCHLNKSPVQTVLDTLLGAFDIQYKLLPIQLVVFYADRTDHFTVFGRVVDSATNEALPSANILIKGTNQGTITNESGHFEFLHEPTDLCTLMVCYVGYNTAQFIADNQSTDDIIKIKLHQKVINVRPLLVTDYRIPKSELMDKNGNINLLTEEFQFLPTASNGDAIQTLQLLPGTKSIFDRLNGLYIQGGTPNQNLVLYDGIPVIRAEHLWGYLNVFNPDAIENVNLLKAGFPAKYGMKLSSVIELDGACRNSDRLKAKVSTDFIAMNLFTSMPLGPKAGCTFTFRRSIKNNSLRNMYYHLQDHLFLLNRRYLTNIDHNNMFDFYDATGKMEYCFSPSHKIALSGFTTFDKIDITKYNQALNKRDGDRFEKWLNHGIGLNWINKMKNYQYNVHLSWSRFENDYFYRYRLFGDLSQTLPHKVIRNKYDIQVEEKDEYHVEYINAKFHQSIQLSKYYNLNVGLQALHMGLHHKRPRDLNSHEVLNQNQEINPLDVEIPQTSHTWIKTIYIENEFNFQNHTHLNFGARTTQYELLKEYYFDPRLDLQIDFTDALNANAKWGQYHQYLHQMTVKAGDYNPLRTSYSWAPANDRLKPEFAEHASVGINYNWNQYHLNISAYQKRLKNVLFLLPSILKESENNFFDVMRIDHGTNHSKGIEFLFWKKYGMFSGWLLYQLGKTTCQFSAINQGKFFQAEYSRTHEINWVGTFNWRDWTCSLLCIYATGVPYSTAEHTMDGIPIEYDFVLYYDRYILNEQKLPHYNRFDLKLTYKKNVYAFKVECGMTIYNIFDRKNVLDQYYNDMPDFFFDQKNDLTELGRTLFFYLGFEI